MRVAIVGVDCATDRRRVGLAFGEWQEGSAWVRDARMCGRNPPAQIIREWLAELGPPVLLALDAPLGWPVALGERLASHSAGDEIVASSEAMFRRDTDRFVREKLRKTPLDVGADRIARTAHAALKLLRELRQALDTEIPLAWDPNALADTSAIEVYPAATLIAHGIRSSGYKKRPDIGERQEIVVALRDHVGLPNDDTKLLAHADALDAAICVLAAKDFLESKAIPPANPERAEREGWIWCAPRES